MKIRIKPCTLRIKTAVALIAVHFLTIAVVISSAQYSQENQHFHALDETINDLEKTLGREKSIVSSVVELSKLARKSGYELSVHDVIKDHGEDMREIHKNLTILKKIKEQRDIEAPLYFVITSIVIQGSILLLYFLWLLTRLLKPIRFMTRQIDDVMAYKKVVFGNIKKPREMNDFYYKFVGLIKLFETELTNKKPGKDRRKPGQTL